jgi:putative oxidoreductase
MKQIPNIVGALLGLAFIVFGLNHFTNWFSPGGGGKPSDTTIAFFTATANGFIDYVKIFEVLGGILVAIPKTRNWGLLIPGPIILNIIAVNVFIMGDGKVFSPILIFISLMSAFLLWDARAKFLNLLNK